MNNMIKKCMALILTLAMIITALPTGLTVVKAAGTVVYIKDTIGGETRTISETSSDATKGWAWNAETSTLTLSGFNGEYIEAEGNLNIVLNGTNTVTVPSSGGKGIDIKGDLTIDDTTSVAADILNLKVEDAEAETILITTYKYGSENTTINGGTVNLTGTTKGGKLYGFYYNVDVYNDAILNINLSDKGNNKYVSGCDSRLELYTSSPVSISVDSLYENSRAIHSCEHNGTGTLNISGLGNAETVSNTFSISATATGTVNVKGYISGQGFAKGKWKVKGYDNYIWHYNVSGQTGSYLLCDSSGNPIKDPVIERVEDLPLRFMDSACFDVASIKVGESYSGGVDPAYGCEGGIGDYRFALAEDSDPLPEGFSINKYYGIISGTATSIHPGGTAKIKVTSGSESATFEINYGAVTYKNPVTGLNLDKDEIILNRGESTTLTATVLPDTADNCDVNWEKDSNQISLTEDDDDSTNVRKATVGVYSYSVPGVYEVTVITEAGNFQKTCAVYVKEVKPNGEVDEDYITGLVSGADYTVDGSAVTADINGRILIDDAWRNKTINLVKTNTEAKCNSDVQELAIGKKEIKADKVTLEYTSVDYDGSAKTPTVTVKYGDTTLTEITDYTLSYSDNTNAGTAKVTITGTGIYSGTVEKEFTIRPLEMTGITVTGFNGAYDGSAHTVTVTGLSVDETITYATEEDGEYSATQPERTEAGTTTVYYRITRANYKTIEGNVTIRVIGTDISGADVDVASGTYVFDGAAKEPEVTVTLSGTELVKNTDYTLTYKDNINAGQAKAVITGKGSYEGSCEAEFTIDQLSIEGKTVQLEINGFTYNGTERTPKVIIEGLTEGTDYTVEYSDNINAGTGTATVTGKGNYKGIATGTFKINKKSITPTITLDNTSYVYNGSEQKPTVTVKNGETVLTESDYTVTYPAEAIKVGTYEVKVELKGNYSGSGSAEYEIKAKEATLTVVLDKTTYEYDGTAKKPVVTVKDGEKVLAESDYTVTYPAEAIKVGTYEVKVELKGNYSGSVSAEYKITQKEITATVTLDNTSYEYDGTAKEPTVKVAGLTASDYDVKYADNINAGTATVTITGKGNYKGTITQTFIIKAKAVKPTLKLAKTSFVYNGKVQKPKVIVKNGSTVMAATEYTVTYEKGCKNVGSYKVTITLNGNYSGTATKTFTINPKSTTA